MLEKSGLYYLAVLGYSEDVLVSYSNITWNMFNYECKVISLSLSLPFLRCLKKRWRRGQRVKYSSPPKAEIHIMPFILKPISHLCQCPA